MKRWRRIYLVFYFIEGSWQSDGEWFYRRGCAEAQVAENARSFSWPGKVEPIDVPAEIIPRSADRPKKSHGPKVRFT